MESEDESAVGRNVSGLTRVHSQGKNSRRKWEERRAKEAKIKGDNRIDFDCKRSGPKMQRE